MTWLTLLGGLLLIFLAAELFTNAVEWFGKHLKLSEGAVGSVLAAVGTALPETTVAIVAVVMGGTANTEAGIGAILGAPMMLSTLAMFITGASILIFSAMKIRKPIIHADYKVVGCDLRTFFLVYLLALVGSAFHSIPAAKFAIAAILIVIYILYVKKTMASESTTDEQSLRPLHFHRRVATPHLRIVVVQLVAGLALMLIGAKEFVDSITIAAGTLGISPLVLSIIITPIATELPEKFNSITWTRHRKDTLALGNITGAMVFQSSILPAIGMLFTPWALNAQAVTAIVIAILATSIIWGEMTLRKRLSPYSLLIGGALYALYPIAVFWLMPMLGYSVKVAH
ncbi:MAG: sodium:calcium antiporter [Armatimonadetes bacterium]|nr:sodium:calcium antiporter [Armatimonadota bacterium]